MKSSEIKSQLRNCCGFDNHQLKRIKQHHIQPPPAKQAPIRTLKTPKCLSALVAQKFDSDRPVPIGLRMTIKLNRVDQLKSSLKPQPAKKLSRFLLWNEWPLDAKIPDYRSTAWPEGSLYFTCGKLCQPLYSHRKEFDLTDPKGHRNPFPMSEYTALHDPLAQGYFKCPTVHRHLQCHRLINDKNEVLCDSVKNYNQYRSYLASLQSDIIEEELKRADEIYSITQDISQAYATSQKLTIDLTDRLAKAREIQESRHSLRVWEVERRIDKWEQQIDRIHKHRIHQRLAADMQQTAADNRSRRMRIKKYIENNLKRKQLLGDILKDEIRRDKSAAQRSIRAELKEKQRAKRFLAYQIRDQHHVELKERLAQDANLRKREWIRNYENHIIFVENNQEKIHKRREAKIQRIKWIRRKYFDLWRKIAQSHRERPNSVHNSHWKMGRELQITISELESMPELTGYDPHHDIFNHILHRGSVKTWKAQLQEQLRKEEDEEKLQNEGEDEDEKSELPEEEEDAEELGNEGEDEGEEDKEKEKSKLPKEFILYGYSKEEEKSKLPEEEDDDDDDVIKPWRPRF